MSELQGMRQLQQTVERLAIRVSAASTDVESEKCKLLQRSIEDLEGQLKDIDERMTTQSERLRHLLHQPNGVKMMEKASFLIRAAPWLMKTLPGWDLRELELFSDGLKALEVDKNNAILTVAGFESPPPKALVSLALAKSGSTLSSLANATRTAVAALPIVGAMMDAQLQRLNDELGNIKINNRSPRNDVDWKIVSEALQHSLYVASFQDSKWLPMVRERGWPEKNFGEQATVMEMSNLFEVAVEVKRLQNALDANSEIQRISEVREMDAYRARLSTQIQHHSEELADAAVITELSRSFSPDAQSALIRFSQIAGAAKFSKSAKPSKMTQRQRRRRQEYLEAFDRCVRQIPCWIMTSSQISQYLPAETLFDLVVIDESSQSDVTVLPGMMRGKQWLIVGDGKQVSPTEAFVSDDDIDNLKASLPGYCPFADALLPGRSFFDMCAQAFPRGRVVLSEHFRCAPEIIDFSNSQFYDGRLIPLRLPTKGERLKPSLIDVKLPNGVKTGKVNEQEADRIVDMAREVMELADTGECGPRSIGIISLLGDDQSRLIRGRLLDAVGPEKMARHEVLIGDPPTFQGAEKDVIFLSMVCSPGSSPTQNQQFHFQRANVAMSRARDRCVLVRSLDLKDIPSLDDSKVPIIEFFMRANLSMEEDEPREDHPSRPTRDKKRYGASLLKFLLGERGYHLVDMGVVWKDAVCVEHQDSDTRAAVMIDCEESSPHEWTSGFAQQKAIERVGWKCLRMDALSLVVDYTAVMADVVKFLSSAGIPDPELEQELHENRANQMEVDPKNVEKRKANPEVIEIDDEEDDDDGIAHVSSEDDRKPAARPDSIKSSFDFDQDESIEASKFGEVVDLNFLLRRKSSDDDGSDESDQDVDDEDYIDADAERNVFGTSVVEKRHRSAARFSKSSFENSAGLTDQKMKSQTSNSNESNPRKSRQLSNENLSDEEEDKSGIGGEEMEENSANSMTSSKRRKRRRLDKYSRDGRWYPGSAPKEGDHDDEWYDTDSDLAKEKPGESHDDESWHGGENDAEYGSEDCEDEGMEEEDEYERIEQGHVAEEVEGNGELEE
jgi:AAA domain